MPEFSLTKGIAHCVADGRAVFLDVTRDLYFCLAAKSEQSFLLDLQGKELSPSDRDRLQSLVRAGVLQVGRSREIDWYRETPRNAVRDIWTLPGHQGAMRELFGLWLAEVAVRRRIRRVPLHRNLEVLAGKKLMAAAPPRNFEEIVKLGWVSEALGPYRSAENRCLSRAYAVASALFAKNVPIQLVFGVSGRPFQAHCWAQYDDMVLTDRLENIRPYTPILAL